MLYSGTDPESYITEYTLVYDENHHVAAGSSPSTRYTSVANCASVSLVGEGGLALQGSGRPRPEQRPHIPGGS